MVAGILGACEMTDETRTASQNLIAELAKDVRIAEPVRQVVLEPAVPVRIQTTIAPLQKPTAPGNPIAKVPVIASPKPNVAGLVKAAAPGLIKTVPAKPKGIVSGNTRQLENGFFRFVLYSETNARKTSTAAQFDTPEFVRIIGTRREEQLLPLKKLGYEYAVAHNAEELDWLLRYPESQWPDWGKMVDTERRRTLILDDGTEAVNMLLDDAQYIDGKEVKNQMRTYVQAGKDLRDILIKTTLRKPINFGMTALAKTKESPTAPEEEIYGPNIPPAMLEMVMTEFEFVFYINKKKWKLQTADTNFTYAYEGPGGPKDMRSCKRTVYAKTKIDLLDVGKDVLLAEENLDLKAIWQKVRKSQGSSK